jgi:hypothetical protein
MPDEAGAPHSSDAILPGYADFVGNEKGLGILSKAFFIRTDRESDRTTPRSVAMPQKKRIMASNRYQNSLRYDSESHANYTVKRAYRIRSECFPWTSLLILVE